MCLTVGRQSRDHRPLSRDPSVLFTKSFLIAWNVEKRCLTVVWRSRDLRPLSRDRSATFFKIFPNRLKRPKNVVWQSADGRVTSDHCRETIQRHFSKFSKITWNVQKSLFDSRPMVAWPPTILARHHILPRRCISRYYYSFRRTAWSSISSYRNGPILEISTSYQS